MTTTTIADRAGLAAAMTGRVLASGDDGWDAARQAFNTLLDQRPDAIALPRDERDVVAAVDHARERGLRVVPQATAHNAGPLGPLDGTLLVSVAELQDVFIDAEALSVRVGAGVRWRQVVPALSKLGLAALHGSSPLVGIAGYSLGGGMGWLARKHGLHTNRVTAFELVTADGVHRRVDAERDPDLFWALRGGGGNFGVVTAIEFGVVRLPELYAGAMFFPLARASEVLHAWRELLPTLPEEVTAWASLLRLPDAPDLPAAVRGGSFAVVYAAVLGTEAEGRRLLRPVRELGPELDTFATVPPVELADLAMDPPEPMPFASAHRLLSELTPEVVDGLVAAAGADSGAPLAMVQMRHMGGALARAAAGAGARATLPGEISLFSAGVPVDPSAAAAIEASLAAVQEAARPQHAGHYPNFVEEPADAEALFDPGTWQRLREVKAAYDPDDLFRGNHHVPPAG